MANHPEFSILDHQQPGHANSLVLCTSPFSRTGPFLLYANLDNLDHRILQRLNEPPDENDTEDPVPLFVSGLDETVDDEKLYEFLAEADTTPISVKICRDKSTANSLGYGYANFVNHQEAAKAIEKLNLAIYNGKRIQLKWSIRDAEARKSCVGKLFIKNLAPSIGEASLYEIFSEIGKVLYVGVARKNDRSSRGYGFVQFGSQDMADFAIQIFNNTIVDGKKILVTRYVNRS